MKSIKLFTIISLSAIALLLIINTKSLMGQPTSNNMLPKLITVIGSAEMSVEPDQVELTITVYSERGNFENMGKGKFFGYYIILWRWTDEQTTLSK